VAAFAGLFVHRGGLALAVSRRAPRAMVAGRMKACLRGPRSSHRHRAWPPRQRLGSRRCPARALDSSTSQPSGSRMARRMPAPGGNHGKRIARALEGDAPRARRSVLRLATRPRACCCRSVSMPCRTQ
jgi:hypothetical protein